jgi:hypothetical protein
MSYNESSTRPSPLSYLAGPPTPEIYHRLQVGRYVVVACLTVSPHSLGSTSPILL